MNERANLLFFMSDNHNRDILGCYGHPIVRTPNLDRIAARGVRFTDAYTASPLCCPARAALATGRFPCRTGYWDNAIVYDGRVPSWMHRLREGGYDVASVGKLHFRSGEDDNGFSEEILAMHIHGAKGGVSMLMRGHDEERVNVGQWELYAERHGVGSAPYQDYDRDITAAAIRWLTERSRTRNRPWALFVSYPSPHPPFQVPQRLLDLYPVERMPLPPLWQPELRPRHPAIDHLRHIKDTRAIDDPAMLRVVLSGYCALITHMDEQVGEVMGAAESLGLLADTRIVYTSDHGEMAGSHGLFGKANMYEGSLAVPLIFAGPGVPEGRVSRQIASHVDLFPTLVEGAGLTPAADDADLDGRSLWPAIAGRDDADRIGYAEYHAAGSRTGSFMLRRGATKLVYHVDMPAQLFDLGADPTESRDLLADGTGRETATKLEAELRRICDPEAVDARAKADQRAKVEHWGGREAVLSEGLLVYTPPPGLPPDRQPNRAAE